MYEFMRWCIEHGKETLESTGLIISLSLAAGSYRAEARERRITNLMAVADAHRELWAEMLEKPDLARILKRHVNLVEQPVSVVEERFVHLLITHLAVTYRAMKTKVLPGLSGLKTDVKEFFALPIPAKVWKWSRRFQEADFIEFVENLTCPQSDATDSK